MSEILDDTQEPIEQPKKVKKGFTLSAETIGLLKAKAEAVGHNQSTVADVVLKFGIPAYNEFGMENLKLVTEAEYCEYQEAVAQMDESMSVAIDSLPEEPVIPVPEPVETKRGRRQKLRIPVQHPNPQQSQTNQQDGAALYRPKFGSSEFPENAGADVQERKDYPPEEQATGLSQTDMDYLVQQMYAMQVMMQQQSAQPQQQPPVNMTPQYVEPEPPPAPTPQFAASYPPGYTGPPGVNPAGIPQQPQGGMYPVPGSQPQQPPPPPPQDPYAMQIGSGAGQGAPLTAQGLLSGSQSMMPNVPGGNVNQQAANAALGPNWREHLRRVSAADRRE